MTRLMAAYVAAYGAALSIVLAMLLLLMIVEVSGGRWFDPFKRFAYSVIATLPLLALLFIPVVVFARALYPWLSPATLAASTRLMVAAKQPYLSPAFALARAGLYWVV